MRLAMIILASSLLSSAVTFFYTTKKMSPRFYHQTINFLEENLRLDRLLASRCSESQSQSSMFDKPKFNSPAEMKKIMDEYRKAVEERNEYLEISDPRKGK